MKNLYDLIKLPRRRKRALLSSVVCIFQYCTRKLVRYVHMDIFAVILEHKFHYSIFEQKYFSKALCIKFILKR